VLGIQKNRSKTAETDRDAGEDWCGPKEPCVRWDGYWRQLANTTERSVRGRHAALRQIILTTLHKNTLYPNIYLHIWHG